VAFFIAVKIADIAPAIRFGQLRFPFIMDCRPQPKSAAVVNRLRSLPVMRAVISAARLRAALPPGRFASGITKLACKFAETTGAAIGLTSRAEAESVKRLRGRLAAPHQERGDCLPQHFGRCVGGGLQIERIIRHLMQ